MSDRKYIPILAAVLLVGTIAAIAYYLFTERKARERLPSGTPPALLEALNAPGGEAITGEELDELRNSLFSPEAGGINQAELEALYDALSTPVQ